MIMRQNRDLAENVWYWVETAINVGEPLFRLDWTTVIFCRVLIEAKGKFPFEMCGLIIGDEWLSFYIKPADGYQLPEIMQWMKQTFSVRFNIVTWRTGGDASIQSGAFYAAAPWRGVQATPSTFRARLLCGVKAMARKELAAFIPYKLSWGCPRWMGIGEKAGDSPKCAFSVSSRRRKKRKPASSAGKTAL
jgi:hypothetical protein